MRRLQLILVSLLLIVFLLIISRGRREGLSSCSVGSATPSKQWSYTGSPLRASNENDVTACGNSCCGNTRCNNYMYNSASKSCTLLTDAQTTGPMVSSPATIMAGSVRHPSSELPEPTRSETGSGSSTTSGSGAGSGTSTTSGSGTGSGTSTTSGTSSSATTCNVERYSNYKRSGPQELAPF